MSFAKKVLVFRDHPVDDPKILGPVRVSIGTPEGVRQTEVRHFKGSPEKPLSWDECVMKFRRCCVHAGQVISEDKQNRLVDMVTNLEKVENIKSKMECLA